MYVCNFGIEEVKKKNYKFKFSLGYREKDVVIEQGERRREMGVGSREKEIIYYNNNNQKVILC